MTLLSRNAENVNTNYCRTLGLIFSALLIYVAFYHVKSIFLDYDIIFVSILLAFIAFKFPLFFYYPSIIWNQLAIILNKLIQPIIFFVLYIIIAVPYKVAMIVGKKPRVVSVNFPSKLSTWSKSEIKIDFLRPF